MRYINSKKLGIFLIGIVFCIAIGSNTLNNLTSYLDISNSPLNLRAAASNNYESALNITWGWDSSEVGQGIAVDSSGNIYITGYTNKMGSNDAFIAKYDSMGQFKWNKTWGGSGNDYSMDIALDDSGNIYITGYTDNIATVSKDAFIIKFNNDGDLIDYEIWGGSEYERGQAIALDDSGNIYITGYNYTSSAQHDAFILKFDNNCDLIDYYIWSESYTQGGNDIALDNSGNTYITGYNATSSSDEDALILKLTSECDYISNFSWGGSYRDIGHGIALDDSGNIYITGQTISFGAGKDDVFILKFNSMGVILFQLTWGRNGDDFGLDIVLDDSRNIYITGDTINDFSGEEDAFIAKFNNNGLIQWIELWRENSDDIGYSIALDNLGNLYITGKTSIFSFDVFIAKYSFFEPSGDRPFGILDLLTNLVGWMVIITALGLGILSGLVIGKKKWDIDAIAKQNKKIMRLKKK